MRRSVLRAVALLIAAGALLAVWVFPIVWGLLTSLKSVGLTK